MRCAAIAWRCAPWLALKTSAHSLSALLEQWIPSSCIALGDATVHASLSDRSQDAPLSTLAHRLHSVSVQLHNRDARSRRSLIGSVTGSPATHSLLVRSTSKCRCCSYALGALSTRSVLAHSLCAGSFARSKHTCPCSLIAACRITQPQPPVSAHRCSVSTHFPAPPLAHPDIWRASDPAPAAQALGTLALGTLAQIGRR